MLIEFCFKAENIEIYMFLYHLYTIYKKYIIQDEGLHS